MRAITLMLAALALGQAKAPSTSDVVSFSVGGTQAAGAVPVAQNSSSVTWRSVSGDFTLNASGLATLAATIAGAKTFSGALTLTAAGTAITVNNNAAVTGALSAGSLTVGGNAALTSSAFRELWTFPLWNSPELRTSGTGLPAMTLQSMIFVTNVSTVGLGGQNDKMLYTDCGSTTYAICTIPCGTAGDTRITCTLADGGSLPAAIPAGSCTQAAMSAGCATTDTGGSAKAGFTIP